MFDLNVYTLGEDAAKAQLDVLAASGARVDLIEMGNEFYITRSAHLPVCAHAQRPLGPRRCYHGGSLPSVLTRPAPFHCRLQLDSGAVRCCCKARGRLRQTAFSQGQDCLCGPADLRGAWVDRGQATD